MQKQRSFGTESPGSSSLGITNKVRRGDIRHAVVVRAKKEIQRKDGGLIRFDDNACVLINKTGDPIGTRLTSMRMLQSPFCNHLQVYRRGRSRAARQAMVQNLVTCTTSRLRKQAVSAVVCSAGHSSTLEYLKNHLPHRPMHS